MRPTTVFRALTAITFVLWVAAAHAGSELTILIFGDSLSSGYGIDTRGSWPALLEKRLHDSGQEIQVINASRRGETSDGGRRRLPDILDKYHPDWVILELGANDGLRRKPLDNLRRNLYEMLNMIKASGATPVLVGMELPPNYAPPYGSDFGVVFSETARRSETLFVPFLLKNVVGHPELFLPDHLHPNEGAQPRLLEVIWSVLGPALLANEGG